MAGGFGYIAFSSFGKDFGQKPLGSFLQGEILFFLYVWLVFGSYLSKPIFIGVSISKVFLAPFPWVQFFIKLIYQVFLFFSNANLGGN